MRVFLLVVKSVKAGLFRAVVVVGAGAVVLLGVSGVSSMCSITKVSSRDASDDFEAMNMSPICSNELRIKFAVGCKLSRSHPVPSPATVSGIL